MQEWLLGEINSNNSLFTATQNYLSMSNPDSATILPCLHHQRNLQRESQLLDRAPRLTTTSAARPARPSREIVLAIYCRPQVFRSLNRARAFRSDIAVRDRFVRVGVLVPTHLHTDTRLRQGALGLMLLLRVEGVGRWRTAKRVLRERKRPCYNNHDNLSGLFVNLCRKARRFCSRVW